MSENSPLIYRLDLVALDEDIATFGNPMDAGVGDYAAQLHITAKCWRDLGPSAQMFLVLDPTGERLPKEWIEGGS